MKKFLFFFLAMTLSVLSTFAQSTPRVDQRQENQKARIQQGVQSGELTKKEASELRKQQRHIKRTEKRAKADGQVTGQEKAKLHRKQKRANKNIAKEKHDRQDRN